MIKRLRLKNFKNFQDAELVLGSFSLLIGTNASGKSNIREAFRFLNGIGRKLSLADILGERYEGGVLTWRGIRGGQREVAFLGSSSFTLEVDYEIHQPEAIVGDYAITVEPTGLRGRPRLTHEKMTANGQTVFEANRDEKDSGMVQIKVGLEEGKGTFSDRVENDRPVLAGFINRIASLRFHQEYPSDLTYNAIEGLTDLLESMAFYEFEPDAMRVPSTPGQVVLGDRGEYLSTVLQEICEDQRKKSSLMEWVKALTPMDVSDLKFPSSLDGKTLLTLVESDGQAISGVSASDGTLRFLAMLAALFSPKPKRFNFFEELENGIHPTRIHHVIEFIEMMVRDRKFQVVATTHSPILLSQISEESLNCASLVYREAGQIQGVIRLIKDIPHAPSILEKQGAGRLLQSGWFENVMYLMSEEKRE